MKPQGVLWHPHLTFAHVGVQVFSYFFVLFFFNQPDPSINQFHFCRDDILLGAFKGEFGREVYFRYLLSFALDFDLDGIPMFSVFLFSALVLWIHRRSCGKFSVSCETLRPGSELLLTQIL